MGVVSVCVSVCVCVCVVPRVCVCVGEKNTLRMSLGISYSG